MFTLYSKPGCLHCDQAKALLKAQGLAYDELILDVGQPKEANKSYVDVLTFKATYPTVRTMPFILLDQKTIGGFLELKRHLNEAS